MNRWEAGIPWDSLGASNMGSITQCRLSGVLASSSTSGDDRYLSGNYLGAAASATLQGGNYGFELVTLTALGVRLPGQDDDHDGLDDEWELRYTVNLDGLFSGGDWDLDRMDDEGEQIAGTDPGDPDSVLRVQETHSGTNDTVVMHWHSVAGKYYDVYYSTNLLDGFELLFPDILGTPSDNVYTDTLGGVEWKFYEVRTE